jgi:hypothetical protein
MKYKGWRIRYFPEGSAHWQAIRYGVSMRANSKAELIQMIDTRDCTF